MTTGEKFALFREWILNQSVEISSKENLYQCMDLAYSWVFFLNIPKATIQNLYAYQVFTNPKPITLKHFEMIKNSPDAVPHVGDLVVFDKTTSNVAGHIAVATGTGNTGKFVSLDQNWGGQSRVSEVTHTYSNPEVLGWLRPIVSQTTQPVEVVTTNTPKVDLEEYGSSVERQSILSMLRDKDKENNRLQVDNQSLLIALKKAQENTAVYTEVITPTDPSESITGSDTIDNSLPPIPENLMSDLFAWVGAWLRRIFHAKNEEKKIT